MFFLPHPHSLKQADDLIDATQNLDGFVSVSGGVKTSVGISTALCPYIGYAKSAEIAKKSLKTGISVKELVLEEGLLKEEELKEILKPEKMTQPMREKVMKAVS